MEAKLIKLGHCKCGQVITGEMLINQHDAKCTNCPAEFYLHWDLEPLYTLEEWEQIEESREKYLVEEDITLPF